MVEKLKNAELRILVVILNEAQAEPAIKLFETAGLPIQYRCRAAGTATDDVTSMLGLEGLDKVMLLSIMPKPIAQKMMDSLLYTLQLKTAGRGIAFTVPLDGISHPAMKLLDEEARQMLFEKVEKGVMNMMQDTVYSLVLVLANQGFSEEIMNTARSQGVAGGSVIRARRLGNQETIRFWGIQVQEEKEIIAIVLPKAEKSGVMKEIAKKHGMHSEARGFVMSVPVDEVAGLA